MVQFCFVLSYISIVTCKPTIVVGLSGGVDSSVAALLLKSQGYEVIGLFMKNWEEDDTLEYCSAAQDLKDVKQVCKILDIPLETVNFSQEYWEKVFSLFLEEYKAGRTPNPDILCNKEIKFKAFLEHAMKLGADYIATGHYAQKFLDNSNQLAQLGVGLDKNKDQSYFLYTLNQYQLSKSLFPIGHLEKPFVRDLALKHDLITHDKKDSSGICFIGERKFKDFLQEFMPAQKGRMQTIEGDVIGQHEGLMFYTLGQRQGLKIGGCKNKPELPWYVVAKDLKANQLIVTQDNTHAWHFSTALNASNLHWVSGQTPQNINYFAKTRYRQSLQACQLNLKDDVLHVTFTEPQRAVTPGQSIVFYQDNICLGGGIIQTTNSQGGLFV